MEPALALIESGRFDPLAIDAELVPWDAAAEAVAATTGKRILIRAEGAS
jgi:fructose-1,6-bisphosphatase/inositol monophosphatase family enzyme